MARARRKTGSSEQFARRTRFDETSSGAGRSNPVVYVVCAVLSCVYSLPVEGKTFRYVSFGASVGALGGIVLGGGGSYFDRLLALDAAAVGTFVVATVSFGVWLWYFTATARKRRQESIGSTKQRMWISGVGYATLMILLFLVAAAPILR